MDDQCMTGEPSGLSVSDRVKTLKPSPENSNCPIRMCNGSGSIWLEPTIEYPNGCYMRCGCVKIRNQNRKRQMLMQRAGLTEAQLKRWRFETFDPARSVTNQEGKSRMAAIKRMAEKYAENPKGWLILQGEFGSGKTHLAYAIAAYRIEKGRPVFAQNVPDLLDTLRQAFEEDERMQLSERMELIRGAELLVLDDLGKENQTSWGTEKLFQIVDYRYRDNLPLVITTNEDLYGDGANVDARVRSRLLDTSLTTILGLPAKDYRRYGGK